MTTSLAPSPSPLDSVLSLLADGSGAETPRQPDGRPATDPCPAGHQRAVRGTPPFEERALVEEACGGDERALDRLCRREWHAVLRIVRGSVGDPEEAEEVTQEVFARAIASLPRFVVTDAPFQAYLAQIARNLLRDRWRREQSRPALEQDVPDGPAAGPAPEAAVLAADDRQVLLNAIRHLPPRYREVLRLRVIEGRTAAEIGAEWGRSPEAVRQIQHRAVLALRGEMAAGGWGAA
ncbi:MAG: RNA polymerase sigma factor [Acidimicrobiales bacterium]